MDCSVPVIIFSRFLFNWFIIELFHYYIVKLIKRLVALFCNLKHLVVLFWC